MKNFITSTLLLLALLLPATATAFDFEVDGIYYNINGNEVTVTKGYGFYGGDVTIPSTVTYRDKTYPVTAIGNGAFYGSNEMTSVTIPSSVTTIGTEAFFWCNSLTSMTIPDAVTSIGERAFYYCSGLTSVDIPSSVISIGHQAFWDCNNLAIVRITDLAAWCNISFASYNSNPLNYAHRLYLNDVEVTDLVIPSSVTAINDYAFFNFTDLKSVNLPVSLTSIGNCAFAYCSNLTSADIPDAVTTIGNEAFSGCESITSLSIPSSVNAIDGNAFCGCSGLTSIIVDSSNPTYDSRDNCNAIIETSSNTLIAGCQNTVIPNTVTAIGDWAFEDCSGLSSVIIPNSVYTIGRGAFSYCTGLTDLTIGNSVTTIDAYAFDNCTGLTSMDIPDVVTFIGEGAFLDCENLTSVTIPNSVTTISTEAFRNCTSLKDVYCYITDPSAITMEHNVFSLDIPDFSGRTLHVPHGTADAYQADWHWFPFFERIVETGHVYGDVNGDDEVNIADINAVIDVILGGDNAAADVNGDGEVNIADVNAVADVILGDYCALDITGTWYSEYAVDEYGKYDIPEQIAVQFTFNANKTGHYSYSTYVNNEIIDCIIELRWVLKGQRLYIWYNDGDYEELYCDIDDNGYLLLSLNQSFTNYTAYRPVVSASAAVDRKPHRQSQDAAAIKSVSRAIKQRN